MPFHILKVLLSIQNNMCVVVCMHNVIYYKAHHDRVNVRFANGDAGCRHKAYGRYEHVRHIGIRKFIV